MKLIDRTDVIRRGNWQRMGCSSEPPIAAYVDDTNRLTIQVFRARGADGTPWEGSLRVGLKWYRNSDPNQGIDIERNWSWLLGFARGGTPPL